MTRVTSALEPICVDIADACKMIAVSRSRLYDLMERGEIRSFKSGRSRLIPVDSLREWAARLEAATPRPDVA